MPTPYETPIGSWTRPTTFFWAATGATFGLANVWQFPYLAGQHGGDPLGGGRDHGEAVPPAVFTESIN